MSEWNYSHIHMATFVGVGKMRTENLFNLIDCNDQNETRSDKMLKFSTRNTYIFGRYSVLTNY